MRIPKTFYLLFVVALLVGLLPLTATARPAAQAPLEADLLARLTQEGSANFFVKMAVEADLSAAYGMDWTARGQYVYDALRQVARTSQAPVIDYAKRHDLDYTSFFSDNTVFVRAGNLAAAQDLAALPGVAYLRLEQVYQMPVPVVAEGGAPQATFSWGITDAKANQVWSQFGVRGGGIVVANIDTGVDSTHVALNPNYKCGTGDDAKCWLDPGTQNCTPPGGAPCDTWAPYYHGTHTMGTIAAKDDPGLQYTVGMAPDAQWIACMGCPNGSCPDFDLNSCADWIVAPGGDPSARPNVVNNSWGGGGGDNWYLAKVNAWRAAGIFPAFSAGNSGSSCNTLGSPGDYQESFGSAAHDVSRAIASFSSRGPSAFGHDPYTKPNLSAPGVDVMSAKPGNTWQLMSGTSMASPHTAGAVALLWSGCPAYLGQMASTFEALQNTAGTPPAGNCGNPGDGGNYTFGYGYLDALTLVTPCVGGTGTLEGTVTDATTGNPIAGATVTAQPAAEGNGIQAVTDPNGFYSMLLLPGTYNVTAGKEDYYSQTVNGVVIVADQTTTQDLALQPLPPPVSLFCDDMESGSGNWTHNAAQGTDDWAIVTTSYHSATHAWYTADVSSVSDKRLWNTAPVALPGDAEFATLAFWHRYGFESGYDGSVIEVSTDGGATWADLGSKITQNGYNSTLSSSYSNPLGGRQAWSGTADWNQVKVDLTAYKGMSVHVRFRIGTDSSVAGTGWWIDDVCYSVQGGGCEPVHDAAFTWSPASPFVGEVVTFDGSALGTEPIGYAWDFGDGGTGSGASVTHSYGAAGDYVVTMTASNACDSQAVQDTVTVAEPAPTMHVGSVQLTKTGTGPWVLTGKGKIHDGSHADLPGVLVQAQWLLPSGTKVYRQFTTGAQGGYQFNLNATVQGQYRFCVVGLVKVGYTYVKTDNHPNPPCRLINTP